MFQRQYEAKRLDLANLLYQGNINEDFSMKNKNTFPKLLLDKTK